MKVCKRCGEKKNLDGFYRHSGMADGYLNICKECKKDDSSRYSKTEAGKNTERRRNQRPQRKEQLAERAKIWRKNNPEKVKEQQYWYPEKRKARIAVANALRDGRLEKGRCKVCRSIETEAHHGDYSKPLDVVWLCKKHHMVVHGRCVEERGKIK